MFVFVGYHDAPADPKLPELPKNLLLTDQSSVPTSLPKSPTKSPNENDMPTNITVNNNHNVVTVTWEFIFTIAAAVVCSVAISQLCLVSHWTCCLSVIDI
jgi:hypothetical protein